MPAVEELKRILEKELAALGLLPALDGVGVRASRYPTRTSRSGGARYRPSTGGSGRCGHANGKSMKNQCGFKAKLALRN
jgi:hypothetical protein